MLCCGSTQNGQMGLGRSQEKTVYTEMVVNPYLKQSCKQVACGIHHTLFLMNEGSVYSCGSNDFEQLGQSKGSHRPQLIDVINSQEHQQIGVGLYFSVVLSSNGNVFLFGSISGDRSKSDKLYFAKPTRVKSFSHKIIQVACGYHHILTLSQDGVVPRSFISDASLLDVSSMGNNSFGQLGIGHKDTVSVPTKLVSLHGVPMYRIACGGYHSIAITTSGSVFTFGSNNCGQLGISEEGNHAWPQHVKQLHGHHPRFASCGESHTVVVTSDGGVFTFGSGMYGQLGHSSNNNESLPRKVFELMGARVSQVACGRYHTIACVPEKKRIYACGLNSSGQLGIGTIESVNTPAILPEIRYGLPTGSQRDVSVPTIVSIFAGGDSTFLKFSRNSKPPVDFRKLNANQAISTLTLDVARSLALISAKSKSHISSDDVGMIEILFHTETCLNASFLSENDLHMNTTLSESGVDLKQAIDVFEKVRSVNPVVESLLVSNMFKMLSNLPRYPAGLESLRVYVILPFCHLFENADLLDKITYPFTNAVNVLSPYASNVIDHWYLQASTTFFDRALHVFKPIVMHILRLPHTSNDSDIYSNTSDEITCYDSFYIPELSDVIDVQMDYLEFINRNVTHGSNANANGAITFCDYPFVFDGIAKCKLLQLDARLKQQLACNNAIGTSVAHMFGLGGSLELPDLRLLITRSQLLHDTIDQLKFCSPDDLKKPLSVIFIGEEGVDAGGVKKEFFLLLMRELLDAKYGMFAYFEETHSIWFNEFSFEEDDMYNLVGKICALAIYNEIIIDLPFPLVLYKKILNDSRLSLEDLRDLDAMTYRSLKSLLAYKGDDFADVFGLTMSIDKDAFGQITTVELVANGRDVRVTKENVGEYVQAYVEHVFNSSVQRQFRPFYDGFHQVMSSSILQMFQPAELMAMVIGTKNYDFDLIQQYVKYEGVFYRDHQVVKWLWDVIREFSLEEKKLFLVFLTGSDRLPMVGIGSFKIIIHPTYGGDQFFPVAHTCFNRLDLPVYSSKALLKSKLQLAIQHDKGFTLA